MSTLPQSVETFIGASPIYRRPISDFVASVARNALPGTRVLDAGAGSAPYRPLFAHCDYKTQDWSISPHPGARQADVIADLASLPVDDEQFDLVVCTEVLEHVSDPDKVLSELHRVTARGGTLALTVPFVIELHEEPYDHFRYTNYGLQVLLARAGFEQVEVTPLSGWFSTLAAVVRHAGLAMRPRVGRVPITTRTASFLLLCVSEPLRIVAPTLDRLDRRRSLPTGWSATAKRPTA